MAVPAQKFETSSAACDFDAGLARGPAIDLVHLARQTMGDEALQLELLGLFDKQAGLAIARLGEECGAGPAQWRADLAHTLKGSARAVGARRVAAGAEAYEIAVRDGRPDLEELAVAVAEARRVIAELLGR